MRTRCRAWWLIGFTTFKWKRKYCSWPASSSRLSSRGDEAVPSFWWCLKVAPGCWGEGWFSLSTACHPRIHRQGVFFPMGCRDFCRESCLNTNTHVELEGFGMCLLYVIHISWTWLSLFLSTCNSSHYWRERYRFWASLTALYRIWSGKPEVSMWGLNSHFVWESGMGVGADVLFRV